MTATNRAALLRWIKFNAVGIIGGAVHFGLLFLLVRILAIHYLSATALAVEMAILHNFWWHWKWTWADRSGGNRRQLLATLLRFNLTNGLISLSGNVLCAGVFTGLWHLDPIFANILAQAPCCLANFFASDRLVFIDNVL